MKRIVHLGFGNFHRAHQAVYTQEAGGWRITGVAMTRPALRDALAPGGFAYTLATRGAEGTREARITVHDRVLVLPEAPWAVVEEIAARNTHVVTLTVTEKGYALDANGQLDLAHPGIAADLTGQAPLTPIGVLAQALIRRAAAGRPLTILSCDNLPENGRRLRAALLRFLAAMGHNLGTYADTSLRCPNSMVDRITPATTDALREEIGEAEPVLTEAFSEWVIEDDFAIDRPNWEDAGAVITPDVRPYELRKLHLLNGAHTLMAYRGLLAGHDYVHEAMADPEIDRMISGLWDEAALCLPDDLHPGLSEYRTGLIGRFCVAEMRHRLDQIAMDGSQKLPVRVVPILRAHLATGSDAPQTEATIAGWLAYLARGDIAADAAAEALLSQPDSDAFENGLSLIGLSDLPGAVLSRIRRLYEAHRTG